MLPSFSRLASTLRRIASPLPPHGPWRIDHLVLPVDDALLRSLVTECKQVACRAEQVEGMVIALAEASPDLAIALWERFRAWDRANTGQPLPAARGVAEFDMATDIEPRQSAGDAVAVASWRAAMALSRLRRLAHAVDGIPSEVMIRTAALARGHEALLRCRIEQLARVWLEAWAVESGQVFEVDFLHVHEGRMGITLEAAIRRPARPIAPWICLAR